MENTNVKTNTVSAQKKYKKRTPMGEVWHRLRKNKGAMVGGAFVLLCDVLARVLFAPFELPVGIVMSFVGGPFFIWLLFRQKGGRRRG